MAAEMANAATWKKGWLIALNAAGLMVPFTAGPGLVSAGYAEKDEDNTANDNRKANVEAHAISILMKVGDELAQTDFPCIAYGTDNQTVQKTGTGVSPAGVFLGLDPVDATRAIVWVGPVAASLAGLFALNKVKIQRVTGTLVAGTLTISTGIVVTATTRVTGINSTVRGGTFPDGGLQSLAAGNVVGVAGTGAVTFTARKIDGTLENACTDTFAALLVD
jgi:hypothetical protein